MAAPVSAQHISRTRHAPGARLPVGRGRVRTGTVVSFALHALILVAFLWRTTDIFGGGHGPGPRGGGGGGRPAATFFTLPPPSAPPQQFALPAVPVVAVSDIPLPDPVQLELPQVTLPREVAPVGQGPGSGPGTGGGQGTGVGPGTGSDVGPGTGGEGDYIQRADLRGSILPPQCLRGRYTVRFWVAADGHVSRVEVTPMLRDGGCRQEMQERMMGYRFRPALNLSGRPVPDIRDITVSH